ncbi:toprim domain-containing protein [Thermoactinomyces daqus]|uniref:Toprim domain-containing protein n=1 Tax=Thermoactinomyces daqus TaxID=1329516 RepID=A0A7W1X8J8_9BACL|nr:toprim domain-containing protein [Thermoactinomyces daqus]MBA4542057.1 toprim domain-containing protein [Thermoactinomyces daqus]
MRIGGHYVSVDVRAELEAFEWDGAKWSERKLQARSPFREDSTPSFYVWLEDSPIHNAYAGQWGDSGGREYVRGSFVTLLAYLRQETEDETREYLLAKYAPGLVGGNLIEAHRAVAQIFENSREFSRAIRRKPIDFSILKKYAFRHPYLERRGISEQVQRAMRIGYDREQKAVVIPWFNQRGELVQIKRRSVSSKFFRYLSADDGGWPVRDLLYGIDVIHRKNIEHAVICEAEIDALYCMTNGIPAIAVGGSSFSDKKRDLILRSPLRRLTIATDNDQAGEKLKRQILASLGGSIQLNILKFPNNSYKDLNDMPADLLKKCVEQAGTTNLLSN